MATRTYGIGCIVYHIIFSIPYKKIGSIQYYIHDGNSCRKGSEY